MDKGTSGPAGHRLAPVLVAVAFMLPGLVPAAPPPGTVARLSAGIAQSLSQILLLLVIIGASASRREFGLRRPRLRDMPAAALVLAALVLAGNALSLALSALVAGAAAAPGTGAAGWSPTGLPVPAAVALGAAFCLAVGYREELFYRAWVIESVRAHGASRAAAVAVSTALFAAGHAWQGPWGMLQAGLLGLALALFWLRGTGLHALAWAHAAFDLGILAAQGALS